MHVEREDRPRQREALPVDRLHVERLLDQPAHLAAQRDADDGAAAPGGERQRGVDDRAPGRDSTWSWTSKPLTTLPVESTISPKSVACTPGSRSASTWRSSDRARKGLPVPLRNSPQETAMSRRKSPLAARSSSMARRNALVLSGRTASTRDGNAMSQMCPLCRCSSAGVFGLLSRLPGDCPCAGELATSSTAARAAVAIRAAVIDRMVARRCRPRSPSR